MLRKLKEVIMKLFRKKVPVVPVVPPPAPGPVPSNPAGFFDDFKTLDHWIVSSWTAPGGSNLHQGKFKPEHVTIRDGALCLKLTQIETPDGEIKSYGGEVTTKLKFGYGIYEFEVRASSTADTPNTSGDAISGSITGCFNYGPASVTEIDVEVEGLSARKNLTHMTSWRGESNPNQSTKVQPVSATALPHRVFHKYAFVWTKNKIEYFRNGVLVATHTTVVPSQAAPMMFNHWGTNNPNWGGVSTPGVDRYMYVKNFKFVPL